MSAFFGYVAGIIIICSVLVLGFMKVMESVPARNAAIVHGVAWNPDAALTGNKRPNSNLSPIYPTAFVRRPAETPAHSP
jgi:hypothetical protein